MKKILIVLIGIFAGLELKADKCKDACIKKAESDHQQRVTKIEADLKVEIATIRANQGCEGTGGPGTIFFVQECIKQATDNAKQAKENSAKSAANEKANCKDCDDPEPPCCE
jgi:hypothetical protein